MSNFHRRDFLTGAAAIAAGTTAALVGTRRVEAGDPSFMNNVPDSLVSGKELPTFKFALEKSPGGKVIGKNSSKEATVEPLPVSKRVSGVTVRRAPGGTRDPHRPATPAGWALAGERSGRTTGIRTL